MKWHDIIIWILFVLALLVVLGYFFGDSPTLEEAILVLLLTLTITGIIQIKENNYRLTLLEKKFSKIEESFIKLIDDFKSMRRKR